MHLCTHAHTHTHTHTHTHRAHTQSHQHRVVTNGNNVLTTSQSLTLTPLLPSLTRAIWCHSILRPRLQVLDFRQHWGVLRLPASAICYSTYTLLEALIRSMMVSFLSRSLARSLARPLSCSLPLFLCVAAVSSSHSLPLHNSTLNSTLEYIHICIERERERERWREGESAREREVTHL
jgi:hypothetical protein